MIWYVAERLTLHRTRASFLLVRQERGVDPLFDIDRIESGWSLEAMWLQGEGSEKDTLRWGRSERSGRAELGCSYSDFWWTGGSSPSAAARFSTWVALQSSG